MSDRRISAAATLAELAERNLKQKAFFKHVASLAQLPNLANGSSSARPDRMLDDEQAASLSRMLIAFAVPQPEDSLWAPVTERDAMIAVAFIRSMPTDK